MEKFGCIYKITNQLNGKIYIGKFVYHHKRNFDNYWGSGVAIQAAYEKYGKENFTKEIIEEIESDNSILCEREIYWISKHNSFHGVGYNMTEGGDGNTDPLQSTIDKQNRKRDKLRKEGKYKKPIITEKHLDQLRERQLEMVEYNKQNGVYDKIAELNRSQEKIEKQRKTMKEKGAPHLSKTFIFENISTGEIVEIYGGFMTFCDSHNLSRKCMRNIADGKRKKAYNNWIVSRKEE